MSDEDGVIRSEYRESMGFHGWFVNVVLVALGGAALASTLCTVAVWRAQVEHQDPMEWVLATSSVTLVFLVIFGALKLLVVRERRRTGD